MARQPARGPRLPQRLPRRAPRRPAAAPRGPRRPGRSAPLSIRPTTTTAPQALLFLDDPWVHAQAARLRDRVVHEAGADEGARLGRLWSLVSQRSPTAEEAAAAREFLATRRADGGDDAAWAALCHALLGSSEAIYVD